MSDSDADRPIELDGRLRASLDRGDSPADIVALARQSVRWRELAGSVGPWRFPQHPTWGTLSRQDWNRGLVSLERVEDGARPVVRGTMAPASSFQLIGHVDAVDRAHRAIGRAPGSLDRGESPVPLDPFLEGMPGIRAYRNVAQREAARAALLCPGGGVLHVVLPTGTGKSLVGLARATGHPGSRTTVIVVPTVALALDQEHKLRGRLTGLHSDALAYLGQMSDRQKAAIADRLRAGTQRVLIASPEAVVGPRLAGALHDLAASGGLDALVIDEAHLAVSWGRTFRPHFQLLGALRRSLHETADRHGRPSFATVTMTGTMTQATAEGLRRVFPPLGLAPEAFVGSAWTRAEPRFTQVESSDLEAARNAVVELMRHLPRPGIVYVNRVDEAEPNPDRPVSGTPLRTLLEEASMTRWLPFTGRTSDSDREHRLSDWAGRDGDSRADWMVATSAFGLGIDVPDVRSIVHLGVPETFDRFYQEVGRSGRDGRASVSVLVTYPSALREAQQLGAEKFLGGAKALPRWRKVRRGPIETDGRRDIGLVHIDVVRRSDDKVPTALDAAWNIHMVRAMEDAGALELLVDPGRDAPESSADDTPIHPPHGPSAAPVTLFARPGPTLDNPSSPEEYDRLVAPARTRAKEAAGREFARLEELVHRTRCVSEIISSAYAVRIPDLHFAARPAPVARGCARCELPACPGSAAGPWTFGFSADPVTTFAPDPDTVLFPPRPQLVLAQPDEIEELILRLLRLRLPRLAGLLEAPTARAARVRRRAIDAGLGWLLSDPVPTPHPSIPSLIRTGETVAPSLMQKRRYPDIILINERTRFAGDRYAILEGGPRVHDPDSLLEELRCS